MTRGQFPAIQAGSLAVLAALVASGCTPMPQPPEAVSASASPVALPAGGFPFRPAVAAGDLLLLSGQIGVRPGETEPVAGGIEAETRQAMDNIGAVLAQHGLGFADLRQCRAYLADMAEWPRFNAAYAAYFPDGRYPARSAMGVSGLALGAAVEIECTAQLRPAIERTAGGALGPYSEAVALGQTVYLSGIIPFDRATGKLAGPTSEEQLAVLFGNLAEVLASNRLAPADVVAATVHLRDPADKPAFDRAWSKFFGATPPARTIVPGMDWGRADLAFEITLTARRGDDQK